MLGILENELCSLVQESALGKRLRTVEILPALDGDNLVKKFAARPPAVYVAIGNFESRDGGIHVRASLAAVAKNARGHVAALHGEGGEIGLYEILWALLATVHDTGTESAIWRVQRGAPDFDPAYEKRGLHVGLVTLEASLSRPTETDLDSLAAFKTITSDISMAPGTDEPATGDNVSLPQT